MFGGRNYGVMDTTKIPQTSICHLCFIALILCHLLGSVL
jgi:hypothetical protein